MILTLVEDEGEFIFSIDRSLGLTKTSNFIDDGLLLDYNIDAIFLDLWLGVNILSHKATP